MRCLLVLLCFVPALVMAGVEDGNQGVLLVAHPRLDETEFARTVIVVTFPQDTGPMGVVLNRPIGVSLGELLQDRPELGGRGDAVYAGGPVQPDGLLFLFRAPEHPVKAVPVLADIYLSGDGELFEALMAKPGDPASQRFFAGYAGWAAGQLDAEIERGDWYVLPADSDSVYDSEPDTLWERMLVRATAQTARVAPEPRVVVSSGR